MKKSKKGSAKAGENQLELSFAVDFHANRIAQPENDSARRMLGTSGRRCLESFKSAAPTRLWARMFLESLVGMPDWYSRRCKLTWRLKGSTYKRLWFQLAVSALPTEGTGFCLLPTPIQNDAEKRGKVTMNGNDGLASFASNGLLPTPDCQNHRDGTKLRKDNNMEDGGSHGVSLHHLGAHGMLPTPQSRDEKNGSKMEDGRMKRKMEEGYSLNLNDLAASRMLPTPRAAEYKGTGPKGSKSNAHRANRDYLDGVIVEEFGTTGQTSQLSGRFVLEMMGFPPDWVEFAFLALENESQNQA